MITSQDVMEAANIAWHIRVNGTDGVTPENLQRMAVVLERLAAAEPLLTELISKIDALPTRTYNSHVLSPTVRAMNALKLKLQT